MLSDDSDTESIHQLTINEHFAKAYEYKKEREELAKLKEKYGSDYEEDEDEEEDSEEGESEDEDGEELTPAVDAAIFRTLARIKKKDPSIYEQGKDVFEEEKKKTREANISKRSSKDKSKPLNIRQHALASVLNPTSRTPSPEPLTHVEEQKALQKETIEAFHIAISGEADEDDDLLIPREKTKDELEKEEEEYREYLQREVGDDLKGLVTIEDDTQIIFEEANEGEERKKERKKRGKSNEKSGKSKQEEDQEFLMNYILNRGWIDKSSKRLPTYQEITGSRKSKGKGKAKANSMSGSDSDGDDEMEVDAVDQLPEDLDEDEDFEEVADRFESSYNFRFEEPDAVNIARYPRNITSLVRREDTTRKEARERRKARKEEGLLKKKEEVKRMKALKMKELRVKLERIGREGGKNLEETQALQELDLEADWDPEEHDRQMGDLYAQVEDDLPIDEDKPHWDDDIDIPDIILPTEADEPSEKKKKKKKKKKKDEDVDDEGGVDIDEMDAEVERMVDEEEWDGTEEMRKRKLDEYMDELYGLEFNDMVGDMTTRFKYTKVQSQAFALTPVEILLATDAELNEYMGIKKYAPYRKDGHNWDKNRAGRLQELKGKLKERVGGSGEVNMPQEKTKKRKGKKERMKAKASPNTSGNGEDGEDADGAKDEDEEDMGGEEQKVVTNDQGQKRKATDDNSLHGSLPPEGPSKKRKRRHKKSGQTES